MSKIIRIIYKNKLDIIVTNIKNEMNTSLKTKKTLQLQCVYVFEPASLTNNNLAKKYNLGQKSKLQRQVKR